MAGRADRARESVQGAENSPRRRPAETLKIKKTIFGAETMLSQTELLHT